MTIELVCFLGWVAFALGYGIMVYFNIRGPGCTVGCIVASMGGAVGSMTLGHILMEM